jgi:hypothetical protein
MTKYSIWLIVLLSAVACADKLRGAEAANLVFVANINSAIEPDELDMQAIMRGSQGNWPNGSPIVLVLPGKKAETYEQVSHHIFGETGVMMQRRWLKLVFSGRGNPPRYVDSEKEIVDLVLNTPGAAAVIRAQYHDSLTKLLVRQYE